MDYLIRKQVANSLGVSRIFDWDVLSYFIDCQAQDLMYFFAAASSIPLHFAANNIEETI